MQDKLRTYIEGLFENTQPTRKSVELKEEMIQNLNDKYTDLVAEGKSPEAAYNIAVVSIGDAGSLIKLIEQDLTDDEIVLNKKAREKSALLTAIAVMMYILSPLALVILHEAGARGSDTIGLTVLFVLVAIATGLLIYNSMSKPQNHAADSVVEEFKEWQDEKREQKSLRGAISSALWSLVVLTYLLVSFLTMAWHITWIIFVFGGVLEAFFNIYYSIRDGKR